MYFPVNSTFRVWLAMKANRNGEKKSLLHLLASQVYSLVLCSFLEACDWANTLQFDFLLQFCPTFAGCWAGPSAAGARPVWEALTLFTVTLPISWTDMSQSHSLLKAPSKSSYQFVVERKLSFGLLIFFGVSLIIIFWLAVSLSMITEEVIFIEGGNSFLW